MNRLGHAYFGSSFPFSFSELLVGSDPFTTPFQPADQYRTRGGGGGRGGSKGCAPHENWRKFIAGMAICS